MALPVFLDAFFLVVYGFARRGLFDKLFEYLSAIGVDIIRGGGLQISSQYLPIFFVLLVVSLLAIFLLYCVFQGAGWWICQGFVKKQPYYSYLLAFLKVSIPWGILILIYNVFSFSAALRNQPNSKILTALLVAVAYFALISYSTLTKSFFQTIRQTFSRGVGRLPWVMPHFLLIAAVFLALYFILSSIAQWYVVLALLQILVVLPLLTVSRIYLIIALRTNQCTP